MLDCTNDPDGIMEDMADYNRMLSQELMEEQSKDDICREIFQCSIDWLDMVLPDPEMYASAMERINQQYDKLNK